MTSDEIRSHLASRKRWIVLSSIGPDGFPHSVPLGHFLAGDRIIMGCRDGTQKVRNVERQPKVSLLWENGRGSDRLIGILIRGTARVVRDYDERLALKQEAARQRGEESIPTEVGDGFVYIEVQPIRVVAWNRPTRRSS
jgi:nitroimidazol reductase NimA-like FMN-containing flavoprotein (pyridoxamine 5'-phosphate oxidase superfamily)